MVVALHTRGTSSANCVKSIFLLLPSYIRSSLQIQIQQCFIAQNYLIFVVCFCLALKWESDSESKSSIFFNKKSITYNKNNLKSKHNSIIIIINIIILIIKMKWFLVCKNKGQKSIPLSNISSWHKMQIGRNDAYSLPWDTASP